jgi:hypothetical protein
LTALAVLDPVAEQLCRWLEANGCEAAAEWHRSRPWELFEVDDFVPAVVRRVGARDDDAVYSAAVSALDQTFAHYGPLPDSAAEVRAHLDRVVRRAAGRALQLRALWYVSSVDTYRRVLGYEAPVVPRSNCLWSRRSVRGPRRARSRGRGRVRARAPGRPSGGDDGGELVANVENGLPRAVAA